MTTYLDRRNAEHEVVHRLFDEIIFTIKKIAYEKRASTLVTAVSTEVYARMEDAIDLMWVSLQEDQRRRLIGHLGSLAGHVRRASFTTVSDKATVHFVSKFTDMVNTLIDFYRSDIEDYHQMIVDTIDLDRFRYTPPPSPEST